MVVTILLFFLCSTYQYLKVLTSPFTSWHVDCLSPHTLPNLDCKPWEGLATSTLVWHKVGVQGIQQLNQCGGTTSIMGTGENLPPTCPRNNPDSVRKPLSAAGYANAQWSSYSHFLSHGHLCPLMILFGSRLCLLAEWSQGDACLT